MLKESHCKENPVPERCRPWDLGFERDTETDEVAVRVKGDGGGTKAAFRVSFPELKEAIAQLE